MGIQPVVAQSLLNIETLTMRDGCKAFINRFMCLCSKMSFKFTIVSIDMHLYLQITKNLYDMKHIKYNCLHILSCQIAISNHISNTIVIHIFLWLQHSPFHRTLQKAPCSVIQSLQKQLFLTLISVYGETTVSQEFGFV